VGIAKREKKKKKKKKKGSEVRANSNRVADAHGRAIT
jgi:hypothetical protein